mmetsp:Transcript_26238/g.56624  ORF Transcript_26238/g.56624 Transcript_26238/m.56624 type:complete len:225 (+) Transcript_26238:386-1060(+)
MRRGDGVAAAVLGEFGARAHSEARADARLVVQPRGEHAHTRVFLLVALPVGSTQRARAERATRREDELAGDLVDTAYARSEPARAQIVVRCDLDQRARLVEVELAVRLVDHVRAARLEGSEAPVAEDARVLLADLALEEGDEPDGVGEAARWHHEAVADFHVLHVGLEGGTLMPTEEALMGAYLPRFVTVLPLLVRVAASSGRSIWRGGRCPLLDWPLRRCQGR